MSDLPFLSLKQIKMSIIAIITAAIEQTIIIIYVELRAYYKLSEV